MPTNIPSIKEDDCERPACSDTVSAMKKLMTEMENSERSSKKKTKKKIQCPPNSATIGKGTWTLLHSMAAWYPDSPSNNDQITIKNFMEGLAKFYPCTYCAEDFRMNVEKNPAR